MRFSDLSVRDLCLSAVYIILLGGGVELCDISDEYQQDPFLHWSFFAAGALFVVVPSVVVLLALKATKKSAPHRKGVKR